MLRLLFWIAVVIAAIWLVRRALAAAQAKDLPKQPPPLDGELVSCARCGVHLPRAEAKAAQGKLFCSADHARLGAGG